MMDLWLEWASRRQWGNKDCPAFDLGCCRNPVALATDPSMPIERQKAAYAECQGSEDPFCGRCRFSVHRCNDGGPSREEYLMGTRRDA